MAAESANSDNFHDASSSQMLTAVLDKLGEITRAASNGSFVFRGEPKWYQEISSSFTESTRHCWNPLVLTASISAICKRRSFATPHASLPILRL